MCGFTYAEATGQNPRIVQGERTDQKVVRAISGALANKSACKVQFVNYRRGELCPRTGGHADHAPSAAGGQAQSGPARLLQRRLGQPQEREEQLAFRAAAHRLAFTLLACCGRISPPSPTPLYQAC